MKKKLSTIALLAAVLATDANAQNHQNRRRGVLLGGLAGAAIGVAIGDKGDNETTGALIGGAVGAVAGGTIGHQQDQINEQNRRYHSHYGHSPYGRPYQGPVTHGSQPGYYQHGAPSYYQPQIYGAAPVQPSAPVSVTPPPPAANPPAATSPTRNSQGVTKQDVLRMHRSGMRDTTIIRQLRLHGVNGALSVQEVIELHEAGISDDVIEAMQAAAPETDSKLTASTTNPIKGTTPKVQSSGNTKPATGVVKRNQGPDELYGPSVLPPPPPRR